MLLPSQNREIILDPQRVDRYERESAGRLVMSEKNDMGCVKCTYFSEFMHECDICLCADNADSPAK